MRKFLFISLLLIGLSPSSFALDMDLFLNSYLDSVVEHTLERPIFNASSNAEDRPVHIHIAAGESLKLTIHNNLNQAVSFAVDGTVRTQLSAGGTSIITLNLSEGNHYYGLGDEWSALSAGGMIIVGEKLDNSYYLKYSECDYSFALNVIQGRAAGEFEPEKFMVNDTEFNVNDSLSREIVRGSVGDSIQIFMYNASDFMHHAPHFHGFHVLIVASDAYPIYEGKSKDSFGMPPKSVFELLLIPDKTGLYPIHNHNLITTTIKGNYPGGMMSQMRISP